MIINSHTLHFYSPKAADGRTILLPDEEKRLRQEISSSSQLENREINYLDVSNQVPIYS